MIGPNVIQAIIDRSGNNWMGFPFLFALCFCASIVIWFYTDVEKGRRDAAAWADNIRTNADFPEQTTWSWISLFFLYDYYCILAKDRFIIIDKIFLDKASKTSGKKKIK